MMGSVSIGRRVAGMARIGAVLLGLTATLGAVSTAQAAPSPLASRPVSGFAELLLPSGPTTAADDADLTAALDAYARQAQPENLSDLEGYLAAHPASPWRVALLTNLGLAYYHHGYFSSAIDAWEQAWTQGRSVTDPAVRPLVDRAVGELIRMHARLGHADRLEALFEEVGERAVTGPATEALAGAKEGLWQMRNNPGVAYLCGPMALKNLLLAQGADAQRVAFLDAYRSPQGGVTLAQVARLADQAKLAYRLVHRAPGEPIPIPSIVHWKVTHFAAIVDEDGDRLHLKDPTFGTDLWISRRALDAEASGYFLVPKDAAAGQPWRPVSLAEAKAPRGMGTTSNSEAGANTPKDDTECPKKICPQVTASAPEPPEHGLVQYDVHGMLVSLNLRDTPVGYRPARGPSAQVTFTYNQREAYQPATFGYFNVGPKWTLNWLSYIQDDPLTAGASVLRAVAGGGAVLYSGYSAATGAFTAETRDAALLVRLVAQDGSVRYERRLADGSVEVYAKSSGATAYPRRLFLSQLIDPAGNLVNLTYDSQLRLTTLTDATGRVTTFSYELAAKPLLLTRVTDPFGRSANLTYDASGRLASITDVLGLVSSFTYDAGSFITAMTTPYGTTQFVAATSGTTRSLEITDPLGAKEAVVYRHDMPGVPFSESVVPSGLTAPVFNAYINARNTAYWNKHAYSQAQLGGTSLDFGKARIKHWTHEKDTTKTAHTLESIKQPLERRVWFSYPGQESNYCCNTGIIGNHDQPSAIARVLDDGSTQLYRYDYNPFGKPIRAVDPVGRETRYEYAANGIDLLRVKQVTPSGEQLIAEVTWNTQHRPLTVRDAAGQLTTYTYNGAGQLLSVTNPLGQVTAYEYDAFGQLTREVNPAGRTALAYTYDGFGRVAGRTDSEGHTVGFAYDALDRLTAVTYPDGSAETTTYDKLDIATTTDRLGRVTTYAYDAVRNLTSVARPDGAVTRYGYYPDGKLKTLTDANGNLTTWERDIQGRITAKVYADASRETYAYEPSTARLKSRTDALAQRTDYAYAKDDRLTALDYVGALEPTPAVRFAFDPSYPRLTQMTDGQGVTVYQYHPVGSLGALELSQEDGPFTNDVIGYSYDVLGRPSGRTVHDKTEVFEYDVLGRPTRHQNPLGDFTTTYLGDSDQPTAERIGTTNLTTWSYLANAQDRRLSALGHPAGMRSHAYSSDAYRISGITESGTGTPLPAQSWVYQYDAADRLTLANGPTAYQYQNDPADNLLAQANAKGTVNTLNQLLKWNGKDLIHNAAGNLTRDNNGRYRYDAEQRLVVMKDGGAFRYDGLGRRVVETANRTDTRLLWCGEAICQVRNAADTPTRYHYPQGELRGTQRLYYATDHLGSVREVRDLASGQTVAAFDYTAYGAIRAQTGSLTPDRGYAGMWRHAPTGLYLTHYRAYSSAYGRWMSRDPIHEAGGVNLYAYVEGDPLNHLDPLGLWRWPQDIYNDAMRDAASRFPRNTWHNGPGDAYRHCLASCMVTQENTETEATIYGWANEKRGNWSHNQEKGEEKMDGTNNAAGRSCGRTAKNTQDCIRGCLSAPLVKSYRPGSTPGYWE